jgi:hypothetical protein
MSPEEKREEKKASASARTKAWREANAERHKASTRDYYLANRERIKARAKVWREANAERQRATILAWEARNAERVRATRQEYRQKNSARLVAKAKAWKAANPGRVRASQRARAAVNVEKLRAARKRWEERNPSAAEESARRYRERNRAEIRARLAASKEGREKRRVLWANQDAILDIYRQAELMTRTTGRLHVVDHIIPLQGREVSGLHVETDLRVIEHRENARKHNAWESPGWQRPGDEAALVAAPRQGSLF